MTKLDFIHIGLGKCMSTRLQHLWNADLRYNAMSARDIAAAVDQIIQRNPENTGQIASELDKINLNFPEFDDGLINMMTSEDLTFSYLHKPELGKAIAAKDKATAKLLAQLTDKVLMLVRNPVDWIRSCHAQQVKEGGSVSLHEYLRSHREIILNNLNLERRIREWSSHGAEVILLPVELASQDEDRFWLAYEERLEASRPSGWQEVVDVVNANVTEYASLESHRQINRLLQLLEGSLERTDLHQKAELTNLLGTARKLCVRRAISYADEALISELGKLLNIDPVNDRTEDVRLDDHYVEVIERDYLTPLSNDANFEDYGCLDIYRDNLYGCKQEPVAELKVGGYWP